MFKLKLLLLLLLTVTLYAPTARYEFINIDDGVNLSENPFLNPATLSSTAEFWRGPYQNLYCPLTYSFWGMLSHFSRHQVQEGNSERVEWDPAPYHIANITVFSLTVIILYCLLSLLFENSWGAFFGALFFAFHPVQVESVAWVSSMKGLLCGLFTYLSLFLFLKFKKEGGTRKVIYALAYGAFLLSLLAKASFLLFPLILILFSHFLFQDKWKKAFFDLVPWFLTSLIFGIITLRLYPADSHLAPQTLSQRIIISFDSLSYYLSQIVFPHALSFDNGRTVASVLASPGLWWKIPVLALLGALVWLDFYRRKNIWSLLAVSIFFLGIFPVLGLKPHDMQAICTTCDRYLYLSILGPVILLSYWINRQKPEPLLYGCLSLLLLAMAVASYSYSAIWKDSFALNSHIVEINPKAVLANNNLATEYGAMGKWDEALEHLMVANEGAPTNGLINANIGKLFLYKKNDYPRAIEWLNKALLLETSSKVLYELGVAYSKEGDQQRAEEYFSRAKAAEAAEQSAG